MVECEVCGRGPQQGTAVFRQNEKGVPGIWRCAVHNKAPISAEVKEITDIIQQAGKENSNGN
jgi:hypothetical protein